jgi:hypothetical protein
MEPDADVRDPGAAVAVALCGHWDHEPPCPLAPHRVRADEEGGELRVRILFAAEPDTEPEVRHLIGLALSGQVESRTASPLHGGCAQAGPVTSGQKRRIKPSTSRSARARRAALGAEGQRSY